ncbi:unnamed protein product, partial [Larinioides sclopetarius]
ISTVSSTDRGDDVPQRLRRSTRARRASSGTPRTRAQHLAEDNINLREDIRDLERRLELAHQAARPSPPAETLRPAAAPSLPARASPPAQPSLPARGSPREPTKRRSDSSCDGPAKRRRNDEPQHPPATPAVEEPRIPARHRPELDRAAARRANLRISKMAKEALNLTFHEEHSGGMRKASSRRSNRNISCPRRQLTSCKPLRKR